MVMRNKMDSGDLLAQLNNLQAKHDAAVEGTASFQAENAQLGAQVKDLQGKVEMYRGSQALHQAEKSQLEARIGEMTAQLEASNRIKDEKEQLEAQINSLAAQLDSATQTKVSSGAEAARIQELEEQLQAASTANHSRVQELEAQVLADAERKTSLEALVASLHKNVEELRTQAHLRDPTADDELVRTLAGPPVQPSGSSGDVPAAAPPPTQTFSFPREPVAVPSIEQHSVPGASAPQLLSPGGSPQSARAKGAPVSPPGKAAGNHLSPAGGRGAPVTPTGSAGGSGRAAGGKAPNRKPPALQPGQAPAAPRLSTSDPQAPHNGSGSATTSMGQRLLMAPNSRGSSSKEAVFPIHAMQSQPQRLVSRDLVGRR
mmetsp:Transcript_25694/g.76664  ORF Transcript_25694/g.76664 Transcript_25694/m.76664 type:complete len:373 (+) Transcript_25694:1927-3045(+)